MEELYIIFSQVKLLKFIDFLNHMKIPYHTLYFSRDKNKFFHLCKFSDYR